MKRNDLIRQIRRAARAKGLEMELVRQGGRHELWRIGSISFPIPRHREIGPKMAFEIRRDLKPELGKDWWR